MRLLIVTLRTVRIQQEAQVPPQGIDHVEELDAVGGVGGGRVAVRVLRLGDLDVSIELEEPLRGVELDIGVLDAKCGGDSRGAGGGQRMCDEYQVDFLPKVKLEVVVKDDAAEAVVIYDLHREGAPGLTQE